ncbi:MAG: calcium-binding protein [Bdellovibrionota bacterium]
MPRSFAFSVASIARRLTKSPLAQLRARRRGAHSSVLAVAELEKRGLMSGTVAFVPNVLATVTSKPVTFTIQTAERATTSTPLSAADLLDPGHRYAAPFEITYPTEIADQVRAYALFGGRLFAVGQLDQGEGFRFTVDLRNSRAFARSPDELLDDVDDFTTFTQPRGTQWVGNSLVTYGSGVFVDADAGFHFSAMYWGADGVPHVMQSAEDGLATYVTPSGIVIGQDGVTQPAVGMLGGRWARLPTAGGFGMALDALDDGSFIVGSDDTSGAVWALDRRTGAYSAKVISFQPSSLGEQPTVLRRVMLDPATGRTIAFGDVLDPQSFSGATGVYALGGTEEGRLLAELQGDFSDADVVGSHVLAGFNDSDGPKIATLDSPEAVLELRDLVSELNLHDVRLEPGGLQYDPALGVIALEVVGFDDEEVAHVYLLTYRYSEAPAAEHPVNGGTFEIDWDGDGVVDETVAGDSGLQVTHAFDSVGAFRPSVTVTTADGDTVGSAAAGQVTVSTTLQQGGTLLVGGTSKHDTITISARPRGAVQVNGLGAPRTFTGVSGIEVYAGGGADFVRANVKVAIFVDLGVGNDSAIVTSPSSVILGGDGSDRIRVAGRRAYVDGGDGNDILSSTATSAILVGGNGSDRFAGGNARTLIISGNAAIAPRATGDLFAELRRGLRANPTPLLVGRVVREDVPARDFITVAPNAFGVFGNEDVRRRIGRRQSLPRLRRLYP